MTRSPVPVLFAVVLAAAAPPGVRGGSRDDVRPFDLTVRVVLDEGVAAASTLADDLETVLVDEIAGRGCYRSVRGVDDDRRGPDDVLFKVRIDEVEDLVEHDVSLARRSLSDDPQDRMRYRSELRLRAETGLLVAGSDRAVLAKPYRVRVVHRPRFVDEDVRAFVRGRLLDDFADRVAAIACSPSTARLETWVRSATDPEGRADRVR